MPDYKKGKIYKIWSPSTDKVYIGSTIDSLSKRFSNHKKPKNQTTSKEIIAFGDARIELIEEYPCNNKMELNRREGEIMREHNHINRLIAGRTREEYRSTPEYKDRTTEYYLDNRTHILEKAKLRYIENREDKLQQSRKYREQNIDQIRAYDRERSIKRSATPEYKAYQKEYKKEYRRKKKENNVNALADQDSDTFLHSEDKLEI